MIELENLDPKKTIAFVVGIEQYDLRVKPLDGPARDAVRLIKWLSDRGVPWKNILVFLSPIESNREYCLEELKPIAAKDGEFPAELWEQPDRDTLIDALTERLPRLGADGLFFLWGGHGVMTGDLERFLIFKNATENNKAAIAVNEILVKLHEKSATGAYPRRQVFFFDACANYFEDLKQSLSLAPLSIAKSSPPDAGIHQYAMHAASPGQRAENDSIKRTGVFFRVVIDFLEKQPAGWPDIEKLKNNVVACFDGSKKQNPVFFEWADWRGTSGKNGNFILLFRQMKLILEAREQVENSQSSIPIDALRKIYYELIHRRSLRGALEKNIGYDGILGELSEYLEQQQGSALPPMYEFLYRVGKAHDERICEWIREKKEIKPLIDLLDRELENEAIVAEQKRRYLLLDFSTEGSRAGKYPPEIEYWIYEENERGICLCPSADARGRRTETGAAARAKEAVREILARANDIPGAHLLFIEILAPLHRLDHDFDQWPMERKEYLIGGSHPLTLRLAERHGGRADARLLRPFETVTNRFSRKAAIAKIEWFPDEKKNCRLEQQIEGFVREKLIDLAGLERTGEKEKRAEFLHAVLRGGAPFVFWFRKSPPNLADCKEMLENLVLGKSHKEIPWTIKDHRAAALGNEDLAGTEFSLLWDDPERDPIRLRLESP